MGLTQKTCYFASELEGVVKFPPGTDICILRGVTLNTQFWVWKLKSPFKKIFFGFPSGSVVKNLLVNA